MEKNTLIEDHNIPWYSLSTLDLETTNNIFDMIIVDGPPAFSYETQHSRLCALHYLLDRNKTNTNFSIFIHDINRKRERLVLKNWEAKLNEKGNVYSEKLAGLL